MGARFDHKGRRFKRPTNSRISSHTRTVASGDPEPARTDSGGPPASPEEDGDSTERRGVPREIGDVSFPVSVRGYDRGAVDAYVSRVQHMVAELELTRSPEAAVKHALEQVGEQTKGILEQAGQTAEQVTLAARQDAEASAARAKHQAEEVLASAKAAAAEVLERSQAEAEQTVAQARKNAAEHLHRSREEVAALRQEAEARMRELHADTETIRHERSQLLDDIREIATRVEEVAGAAEARFPHSEASDQAEEEKLQSRSTNEAAA
jgi:DivIVA domain-containing protein